MEDKFLEPSPPADKTTLIRRASFDLIGLPPTPEEVQAFLRDESPGAFERVIDRLLLSPHYGERWARHWLDLARYAESEGFKADETRPNIWRYRDYVVQAFNDDKPYDRFVMEQLAGDELWPGNPEAFIATAFNRHYPDESNARNLRQRRQEILNDITDTVGAVFTGLTFGCARCHDHKFDPILQKDYYRLQAFFANSAAMDNVPVLSIIQEAEYQRSLADWEFATRSLREKMEVIEKPEREAILKDYVDKYPDEIQAALAKNAEDRSPFECQMAAKAELYLKPSSHQYIAKSGAIVGRLKGEKKKEWEALQAELRRFDYLHPGQFPTVTGISDLSAEAPKTYLLKGGAWEAPTEEIEPGFLSILNPAATPILPPLSGQSTGRRTALAKLLTDPENPLVARVLVNRVWQSHFGKGLAATASDFGFKGEPPTHPALIDWLASEFVRGGWSLKKLHKLILLSGTYQQSSQNRAEAARIDSENKLLWRFPRQRLEGEVIRDASLYVAGLMNSKMGGPSIFPELPSGMEKTGGWSLSKDPDERNRRSIYVFVRRNLRYPLFQTFDMPDTHESCARRNCTTSPLQALTMINSQMTLEWARAFADRVLALSGGDPARQVQSAYLLAFGRDPSPADYSLASHFFTGHA
ncbi:MAG TPA: DUF1549 and DUF1553 domain-containing protein, partial [Verrucomicrobiae bacterium]|nr:DUF1549 and DUF1553 domain-containing protein [Verrucomicrobiae bacterium]